MSKIRKIHVEYTDGSYFEIDTWEIEKLEKLVETMSLIERAQRLFNALEPVFIKEKKTP